MPRIGCECPGSEPVLTLVMLGVAVLLGLWMFVRGGMKMSKGQATSVLAVVVVLGVIGGTAWFNVQGSGGPAMESAAVSEAAPMAQAAGSPAGQAGEEAATAAPDGAKLPRLVDLGAKQCLPCKKMAPILDELREQYAGRLKVEFIDVWENRSAAQPYRIRVIPTQILYDGDGKELWRHEGFISKEDLQKLFAERVDVRPEA